MKRVLTTLACGFVIIGAALPAVAQQARETAPQGSTTVTVPLQDLQGSEGFGERAERLWSDLIGSFGRTSSANQMMRSAADTARRHARARDDFAWLMDVAGYKLKEIESYVSLVPSLSLTFGQARELTEADRDYVERQLERHARRNPGPFEAMQRAVVRAVLDASEIGDFSVEKVEIDLFPLPRVKFVLTPADAPVGIEAARILRAIDRLNQNLRSGEIRPQELDIQPTRPSTGLQPAALREIAQ